MPELLWWLLAVSAMDKGESRLMLANMGKRQGYSCGNIDENRVMKKIKKGGREESGRGEFRTKNFGSP